MDDENFRHSFDQGRIVFLVLVLLPDFCNERGSSGGWGWGGWGVRGLGVSAVPRSHGRSTDCRENNPKTDTRLQLNGERP